MYGKELKTRMIVADTGDNPKLGAKTLSDGRESLFLEYYYGYTKTIDKQTGKERVTADRRREFLKLYLWVSPRTPAERQHNKDTIEIAKTIRFERGQEMLMGRIGHRVQRIQNLNFLDYFQNYVDNYTKRDYRVMRLALKRFRDFLTSTEEYEIYSQRIKPEQLTRDMVRDFTEYLKAGSMGEGAKTIYARFKKAVKYAVEHDVIRKDPCAGIVIKIDDQRITKEILSLEEVQQLIRTHYRNEKSDVRRAFVLSLYAGLRFCDVKDLTFENVDYTNRLLKFEQAKTKGHSVNSGVVIPLRDDLLQLIGEQPAGKPKATRIFNLPGYSTCLTELARWVESAGINKHITWHCARHSFAVNILNNGANIKTVASLLGHSGLKHTEKYTRAVDSLKQEAINGLPAIGDDAQ